MSNNSGWSYILNQVGKDRLTKNPNPWLHPIKEDFRATTDIPISSDTSSPEFPDTLSLRNINRQIRKEKKSKGNRAERIIDKSLLLSTRIRNP